MTGLQLLSSTANEVAGSIFGGIIPIRPGIATGVLAVIAFAGGTTASCVGKATAINPGRITRNGKNIFGIAAIKGVLRAALIESAAIARCTTRKSVHQYPNDSTNPKPIAKPNTSTPSGFVDA